MKEISKYRKPSYPIHPLILNRWSPRALSGEDISDEELMILFEAARWAPSSYNNQPWKFLYAKKDTDHWNIFFDLLVDFNKSWADKAAVLVVVISHKFFELNNKPSKTHNFDAGAAWQNLALQGSSMGLIAHGMEGFSYKKARKVLNIPDEYDVEAMIAIGKKGSKDILDEALQQREFPSSRKEISKIIKDGSF